MELRKCNTSCCYYLTSEKRGERPICCYENPIIDVSRGDKCKYKFVAKSEFKKFLSPEERLLRAIFDSSTDITEKEALEQLAIPKSRKPDSNKKT